MWIDQALGSLGSLARDGAPSLAGAPARDLLRSPAALRVARLAASDGLFCFHFEHRFELDAPDDWAAPGEPVEVPTWTDGVLPEPKYRNFRHDLAIASFNPGHRGKWTTHELCHALVGFAWRPGASGLWHATAARVAELLPVVLYYFLDEVRGARCPDHEGGGPLYREYCADCEAAEGFGPVGGDDARHLADGLRFLEDELVAVARTRRTGTPIAHRFGSLDLCSDGLAYARSHGPRLGSEAMERLAPFLVEGGGWWTRLDDLEARVLEVARGILLGEPVAPLAPSPEDGMARWIRQDLAFRLLTVREQTEGEAREGIEAIVEGLADAPLTEAIDAWKALEADYVLPSAEQVFAVGYDLPGSPLGRSHAQVRDGLRSVSPLVTELADEAGVDLTRAFLAEDRPERASLGDRFHAWVSRSHPALAPLCGLEVAVRVARADPLALLGPGEGVRLASGARILRSEGDLVALSEAVDSGDVRAVVGAEGLRLEGWDGGDPSALAVGRDASGDLVLLALDPSDADELLAGTLADPLASQLIGHGVARAARWPLSSGASPDRS